MNFFQENETCIVVDGKKSFVVARIWGWCVMMVISQTQGERERTRARHYYKDASIHSTERKILLLLLSVFSGLPLVCLEFILAIVILYCVLWCK